ncbi:MAG: creatininase family protein [Treponema sp.]|jgi:creatinine amidohydrolase|nr:creatininase family protein [Treponema sp.]
MQQEIRLMSWTEFDERRKSTDLVIVPTGSVEAYGPHLPLASDSLAALGIARKVAELTGALISPPVDMGESSSILGFPGTFTLKKETFQQVVDELVTQLINYGFQRFLFVTGHGGNVDTINYLAKKYRRQHNVRCGQVDWWRFAAQNDEGIFQEKGVMCHGHASECGTSVLLYLYPELVHMERAVRREPKETSGTSFSGIIRYDFLEEKTDCAIIGDPTKAAAEKGARIVDRCVSRIVEYIEQELTQKE